MHKYILSAILLLLISIIYFKYNNKENFDNIENIFTIDTFNLWFNSTTKADSQLQNVLMTNNFEKKIPTYNNISQTLFNCNSIYDNYIIPQNFHKIDANPEGAHFTQKTIDILLSKLDKEPKFGIEVGSFIGSSSLLLGNIMKKNNGVLLCIDTWCGDINMWLMPEFQEYMNKNDGNPKLYDLFMVNIMNNNLKDYVIPLRVSSIVGARMLKVLNYEIDFVYLDSSHEAGETFMELMLYHDILKNKGILFGDDYNNFPAVKYDVDLFCKHFNYELFFTGDGDTWLIQKNI